MITNVSIYICDNEELVKETNIVKEYMTSLDKLAKRIYNTKNHENKKCIKNLLLINSFQPSAAFHIETSYYICSSISYPLKMSGNQRFSDVSRVYRNGRANDCFLNEK